MYRNTLKPSYFSIELPLVFLNKQIICNHTNLAWISVYWENIDFLKNFRLNSHKNVLKRRSVQKYNKTKLFFHWITASFSEKHIICNHTNLAYISVYWKIIDFHKNCRLNSHKNVLKRRSVQRYTKTKHFFHWITASFSSKTYHLQSY